MPSFLRTVGVRLLDLPYYLDNTYTYYVPDTLPEITRGMFVIVPFGAGNKKQYALAEEIGTEAHTESLKPVLSVINPELTLSEELLGLVGFLRERTFCTTGDAVRRLIPAEAFERADEYYFAVGDFDITSVNERAGIIYEYVKSKSGGAGAKELSKNFSDDVKPLLSRLVQSGALKTELKIESGASTPMEKIVSAAENPDTTLLSMPRTPAALTPLFYRISEAGSIPLSVLTDEGYLSRHVTMLEKRRLITVRQREKLRIPYEDIIISPKKPSLSEEQKNAEEKILALLDGKPHGALLYGVTGSGKTSVVLSVCEEVVRRGKTAIVLVPEIALTWQSVSVFAARFGDRLAVIHSALSGGERFDAYKRIKRGEVDIVLGTRSAVFAPLERLALIVIDEEQEHSYKSDMSPKYSARDIARYRCAGSGALMLLCSATPSVETFYRAKSGIYSLIELKNRYGHAKLPEVILSDMRKDGSAAEFKILGKKLCTELIENYNRGRQSMLFLNRRGYSNFLLCRKCGEAVICPNCSVALALHKDKRGNYLLCHYCGYKKAPPEKCPSCGSEHIDQIGYGTQMLEETVHALIPGASVLRMDADTTKGKFSRDEIVSKFTAGDADILIGTQMIAKGHNFPKVTLAAVISADSTLYGDDYRAGERTFSLLTQLVGRSGRGEDEGRAIIQTYSPENEAVILGAEQNYEKFYKNEIALRRALTFPPFCDMALFSVASDEEKALNEFAKWLGEELSRLAREEFSDVPMTVFGPFDAPIYKMKNKYRKKIVVKHKNNARSREFFKALFCKAEKRAAGKLSVSIDINPTNI